MNEYEEYYKALGLEPGASLDKVTEAYADLVKVWDPDRFPGQPRLQEKAEQRQRELTEAYERLLVLLLAPAPPPVPGTSHEDSMRAIPAGVTPPPIPGTFQEEVEEQEVASEATPPVPAGEDRPHLSPAKTGLSSEAKFAWTLIGIVFSILLLIAFLTNQKSRPGKPPATSEVLSAEDLVAYWAVKGKRDGNNYIHPAVRFRLRNGGESEVGGVQTMAVFRLESNPDDAWGNAYEYSISGEPIAPRDVSRVITLRCDSTFYSKDEPRRMLENEQWEQVFVELFFRAGSSSWKSVAKIEVPKRLGARSVEATTQARQEERAPPVSSSHTSEPVRKEATPRRPATRLIFGDENTIVYAVPGSKVYHRSTCKVIQDHLLAGGQLQHIKLSQLTLAWIPCDICNPPNVWKRHIYDH